MTEMDSINITLSDIGKSSGLNTALVRYYFGNKRGMLYALADRAAAPAVEKLSEIVSADISATEKMKRYIVLLTDTYFHHPYLNRLWPHLCKTDDEYAEKILNEFLLTVKGFIYSMLDQGVESGEFKAVNNAFFSYQFMASCDALFRSTGLSKRAFDVEGINDKMKDDYAAHLVDTILGGLAAK